MQREEKYAGGEKRPRTKRVTKPVICAVCKRVIGSAQALISHAKIHEPKKKPRLEEHAPAEKNVATDQAPTPTVHLHDGFEATAIDSLFGYSSGSATSSSSSLSSSSSSVPAWLMQTPLESPPPVITSSTCVGEVLCELHDAPEHPTGTQLRLLISRAHVDAVQPSVTLHGFDGGPTTTGRGHSSPSVKSTAAEPTMTVGWPSSCATSIGADSCA